jgi:HSP20 family protein
VERESCGAVRKQRQGARATFRIQAGDHASVNEAVPPGFDEEIAGDLEITTTGNRLQISGKRETDRESKSRTVYLYERHHGSFTRAFTLPDSADLDYATSELEEGVLTLVIPKKPGAQARTIAITGSGSK